jgi:hypothetical protein
LIELLTALVSALHLFTCAFWRVKIESSTPEDVSLWLVKYSVDPSVDVSRHHAHPAPLPKVQNGDTVRDTGDNGDTDSGGRELSAKVP